MSRTHQVMVSNPVAISLSSLLRYCFILSPMPFCILVFSLISVTSSSSLLSFCWSSNCWDAPDLRTRPLSHLVHIFLLFFNQKQKNNCHSLLHQPNCFLCTYVSPFLYYLVYSYTHTHTQSIFTCVLVLSVSPYQNTSFMRTITSGTCLSMHLSKGLHIGGVELNFTEYITQEITCYSMTIYAYIK